MDQVQDKELQRLKECISTLQDESKEYQNERQSLFRDLSDEIKFLMQKCGQIDWNMEEKNGEKIEERNKLENVPFRVQWYAIHQQNKKCKQIIWNQDQLIARYECELKQKDQKALKMQRRLKEKKQELRQTSAELKEKTQVLNEILQDLKIKQEVMNENEKILQQRERQFDIIMQKLERQVEQAKSQLEKSLQPQDRFLKLQEKPLNQHQRILDYQDQHSQFPSQKRTLFEAQFMQYSTSKLRHLESTSQESSSQLNDKNQLLKETMQRLNFTQRNLKDKNQKIQSLEQELISQRQKYQLQLQAHMQQHFIKMEAQNCQKTLEIEQLIKQNIIQSHKKINELTLNYETKLKEAQNKNIELQNSLKQLMAQNQNFKETKNNEKERILQSKIADLTKMMTQKKFHLTRSKEQLGKVSKKLHQKDEQFKKIQIANKFLQTKNADLMGQMQKCKRLHEETNSIANKRLRFIQNQLEETRKTNINYKKSLSNLSQMVQSLKREAVNKSISIQSLERQLQRAKSYNEILLRDVKSLNENVKTLNQQIQEMQESSQNLKKIASREEINKNKLTNRVFGSRSFEPVLSQTKSLGYFSRDEGQKRGSTFLLKQYKSSLMQNKKIQMTKRNIQSNFSAQAVQRKTNENEKKLILPDQSQNQSGLTHLYSMETTFSPNIPSSNQKGQNNAGSFFRNQSLKINFNQLSLAEQIQNLQLSNHSNILSDQIQDIKFEEFLNQPKPITFRKNSQQQNTNHKQMHNNHVQDGAKVDTLETEQQNSQDADQVWI